MQIFKNIKICPKIFQDFKCFDLLNPFSIFFFFFFNNEYYFTISCPRYRYGLVTVFWSMPIAEKMQNFGKIVGTLVIKDRAYTIL